MRQTIKEIEVNMAYRWFLGYSPQDKIPHFTTFGKNYVRRFQHTDLFEQIFDHILAIAMEKGFVNPKALFIDSTYVKAHTNWMEKTFKTEGFFSYFCLKIIFVENLC